MTEQKRDSGKSVLNILVGLNAAKQQPMHPEKTTEGASGAEKSESSQPKEEIVPPREMMPGILKNTERTIQTLKGISASPNAGPDTKLAADLAQPFLQETKALEQELAVGPQKVVANKETASSAPTLGGSSSAASEGSPPEKQG